MPGLEKRLARYPQLYSRIGFAHEFKILSQAEITFLLERHLHQLGFKLQEGEFADAEALAAIIRITNGNFRLLNRLLTQIKRVMEINQLGYITKEVVETARDCLVIGTI
jgi:DNA transposition AAA+ family ATPase